MSARRIVALPVDGRPVVRAQVQSLLACAGWELAMPAVAELGHLRRAADRDRLAAWLAAEAPQAAGFVLSLDMLAYGGLVPSRFIPDELDALRRRLALLPALKAANPGAPVYAFAATMRISNNDVNEEEKEYWAQYGSLIWRWSYLTDRAAMRGDPEDVAAARAAAHAIPAHIREDYLNTRARNAALVEHVLELVADGTIERLVLPQDDTAEFGFNIGERRHLERRVRQLGLDERVAIYPGADEVMHTLCARMVGTLEGAAPLSFHLHCSDPAHVGSLHALYEDRPLLATVASQVAAVGGRIAAGPDDADVILALHTSGPAQGDWAMGRPLAQPVAPAPGWLAALAAWHASGKPVALADLAYANGGDPVMVGAVARALPLCDLAAYAGWNTAGNSLGGLLAQCVLARADYRAPSNRAVLCLRLLEDLLYQAIVRQAVRLGAQEAGQAAQALRERVALAFTAHADAWARGHGLGFQVANVYLPWDRSFEIGIDLVPAGGQACS
jgi:hypothetical protein